MKERSGIFLRKESTRSGSSVDFLGGSFTEVSFEVPGAREDVGAGVRDDSDEDFSLISGAATCFRSVSVCLVWSLTSKTAGTDARLASGGALVSCKLVNPCNG